MTTKRISNVKIDNVTSIMCAEAFNDKIEKLKEKIGKKVDEYVVQFVSPDVLKLYEKYSYYMHRGPSIGIYSKDGYEFSHYTKLPKIEEKHQDHKFKSDEKLNKLIRNEVEQLRELKKKKNSLRNKISCVLSDLKTYNKIKNEFPEAYKVLVEQVDGATIVKDTCTEVESVRAELTKI